MGVSTKGVVLIDEDKKDVIEILDNIKNACDEIYREKGREAFYTLNPDYVGEKRPIVASLPQEEKDKFSHPKIEYSSGFFQAQFSYRNDSGEAESRNLSIFTDKKFNRDLNIELEREGENVPEESGIIISFNKWGDSQEIMTRILEKFGDAHPSYLIKDDCAGLSKPGNIVKVGNAPETTPIELSPEEEPVQRPRRKM